MTTLRPFFNEYTSHLLPPMAIKGPVPPEDTVVLVKAPKVHPKEMEAMWTKRLGCSEPRWRLFNVRGTKTSYPFRGWHPDSWRFINGPGSEHRELSAPPSEGNERPDTETTIYWPARGT